VQRSYSLKRRAQPKLKHLLVTLGGVDKDNITAKVLTALRTSSLPANCEITVVMGSTAPWLADVQEQAQNMPWSTKVCVGVSNMAQLMANSDFAIGAAGATAWERCCLGLPSCMVVLAENQSRIARGLADVGAAILLDGKDLLGCSELLASVLNQFPSITRSAAAITDGLGVERVIECLLKQAKHAN
jgi:spore coat polysaccharide biosynthesis predicted glycosyltransferase SpsG